LNQGDGTVSRIDAKTAKLVATIEVGVPGGGGEIAFGFGHVWATVFEIPISEIDPATNQVVRQWKGPGGDSIRIGHGSLWLSNLREQNLWRIDLKDAPDGESGTLPAAWITGGPRCMEVPDWQVHEYNANFYILRESGCIHYEKPFLYLIFGADRALLVDTGAGTADTAAFVQNLIGKWLERNHRASIPLLVVHSHGHGDHTAGDQKLAALAGTTVIPATPEAAHKAFAIENWPEQIGQIDLGGRVLDVIPIPGHQAAQVAYYDRKTGVLLTGDHLYPGRLYVADFAAYTASTRRLVHFTEDHPVTHILGAHIEQTSAPFTDYPVGRMYQPREHVLELGRAQLLELMAGLEKMNGKPARVRFRDFTIWPNETRTREETEAARKAAEEERANKWNQPKQP
jgi:glyoxylase-like metal-dependent hydrolase (beta-lactamase superfamily II)